MTTMVTVYQVQRIEDKSPVVEYTDSHVAHRRCGEMNTQRGMVTYQVHEYQERKKA